MAEVKLKSFKVEYTVAGSRGVPASRIVQAVNVAMAQREFHSAVSDKTDPEIVNVWQHVAVGSTKVVRTNVIKRV